MYGAQYVLFVREPRKVARGVKPRTVHFVRNPVVIAFSAAAVTGGSCRAICCPHFRRLCPVVTKDPTRNFVHLMISPNHSGRFAVEKRNASFVRL